VVNLKRFLFIFFISFLLLAVGSYLYKIYSVQPASTDLQTEENRTPEEPADTEEEIKTPVEKPDIPIDEETVNPPINDVELITYNGPIEHIFFHPLVVYPSLAFDGDAMSQGYNEYFVTVDEFNGIIQSLYEKNYILIKMSDLFAERMIDGKNTLVKKELKLPKDKTPLIISVDDINYYEYMIENGNAYRLVLDPEGELATYSKDLAGNEVVSKENEIVPLLEQFVEEHPDFSLNNAKGILALTGYEGILGYRTNEINSPNFKHEKEEVLKVIQKLKDDGWEFASHGYGHLTVNKISLQTLKNDTNHWLEEVSPLIGGTNIYIYPFGSSVLPGDEKFQYLMSSGFNILCSVGPNPYLQYTEDYSMMDRVHIDGIGLETQKDLLQRFFDSEAIIDQERYKYH
jgi:hypothetical protein